jgi:sulfoxide reductase heme-binding subunit YedZ
MQARTRRRLAHAGITAAGLLPALALAVAAFRDTLGANPIEAITHETGDWALRLLLAALAVTPLRRLCGWSALAPYRRTLGLLAFGYASLHFLTWIGLDLFFDWRAIAEDVLERPFVTAGLTALLCLLPLAITSTRGWMRRLGRRWQTLHRLVYVAAVAAVVHFLWLVKSDLREPLIYAAVLAALLGIRLGYRFGRRAQAREPA